MQPQLKIPTGFVECPSNKVRKDGQRFFESKTCQIVEKADKTVYIAQKDGYKGFNFFDFDNLEQAFRFTINNLIPKPLPQ